MFRIQATGGAGQVGIRQASGADCDAIGRFLAGLSPKSLYLRFFTGAPPVTGAMLRRLAGEGGNVDVVVATEDGTIIGHAMAAETSGPADARVIEIGVAVTDARQGRGIGTALTRELAARAGARGTRTVTMDVLAENRRALAMIGRAWPAARYERSGPFVTIRASLARPEDSPAQTDGTTRTDGRAGNDNAARTDGVAQPGSPARPGSAVHTDGTVQLKEERPGEPVPIC